MELLLKIRWLVLFFHSVLFLFTEQVLARATTVSIATIEFPPYASASLTEHGLYNAIVAAAFAQEGIEVEFTYLPFSRALSETMKGNYDALSYAYFEADRRTTLYYSDPFATDAIHFITHNSSAVTRWQDIKQIANYRVGLTRGYSVVPKLAKAISGSEKVAIVNSDLQNLQLLRHGRIDVFPVELPSFYFLLDEHFSESEQKEFRVLAKALDHRKSYLAISKTRPEAQNLLRIFNRGLSKLKSSGELEILQNRRPTYIPSEH